EFGEVTQYFGGVDGMPAAQWWGVDGHIDDVLVGEHGGGADGYAGGERDGDGAGGQVRLVLIWMPASAGSSRTHPRRSRPISAVAGTARCSKRVRRMVVRSGPVGSCTVRFSCSNGCAVSNRVRHSMRESLSLHG